MNDLEKGRIQGTVMAAAFLITQIDKPTMARDILRDAGIDIKDMRKADVDNYDFKPVEKLLLNQD